MGFSFKNIKKNLQRQQEDPYFAIKFQYKMQRIFIYFIMGIIAITFISMIWNFNVSSSMGRIVQVFMIFIMFYLLYQIYSRTLLPIKKTLQHYELSPQEITENKIDVAKEVDNILDNYDTDGNRKQKV